MTEFHTLNDVAEVVLREGTRKRLAVAAAEDSHTLEAVLKAYDKGFVTPVLTGNRERIIETLKQFGRDAEAFPIHHADDPDEAASTAVQLVL